MQNCQKKFEKKLKKNEKKLKNGKKLKTEKIEKKGKN